MGAIVGGYMSSGDYEFALPAGSHYLHATPTHLAILGGKLVYGNTSTSPSLTQTAVLSTGKLLAGPTLIPYQTDNLYSAVGMWYLNNIYFLANNNSQLFSSTDGITWTYRAAVPASSMAYGNGIYLAVSAASTYFTSVDGINWTSRTSPYADTASVTFGNGKFVWVSYQNINTSTDGITWAYARSWSSSGTSTRPNSPVIFSGTTFWFGADGVSDVGSVWRCIGDPTVSANWTEFFYRNVTANRTAVTAYNDNVIVVQNYGTAGYQTMTISRSTNAGATWTTLTPSSLGWGASIPNSISQVYTGGYFSNGTLAFGFRTDSTSGYAYSLDGGITWAFKSSITNLAGWAGRCLFSAGNYVLAVSNLIGGYASVFNATLSNGSASMTIMSNSYQTLN
jgi:hypothetical protein